MTFKINQISECTTCREYLREYLKEHPTLDVRDVLKVSKSYPTGQYKHTTRNGVFLHAVAVKHK